MSEVTRILEAIKEGDPQAAEQLLPLVYDELRRLASQKMAHETPGQTLEATGLVHEAYLRLVNTGDDLQWDSRGHFFAAAAEAMRRILVENARRKRSVKRGGGLIRHDLDQAPPASGASPSEAAELREDVLAVDEALGRLAAQDPLKAELVKLRYFAGLTLEQSAQALGISSTTADRYWAYARAWLHQEITRGGGERLPPST
jgi:RNA polymerase sigma factor (TIGR02999 family)